MKQLASKQEVQFYDISVPDWPGEIDFYLGIANEVKEKGGSILEVGCGTGRVALRLALEGIPVTGMDLSPEMLAAARQKSQGVSNVRWVESDMKDFDLFERFDLIIIPGHSFQFMLTPSDQIACLKSIGHHLENDGKLVIHLNHDDISWLGGLIQGKGTDFQLAGEVKLDKKEGTMRKWNAWNYDSSTQTASVVTAWELIGEDGLIKKREETEKKHLHCFFRYEMEHLLALTGFKIEALYGDFYLMEPYNTCPDMIWVAGKC